MALVHRQPWSLWQSIQHDWDPVFAHPVSPATSRSFVPPADISHYADRVECCVDLPGVSADQVDIRLEGKLLTLRGQRTVSATPASAEGAEALIAARLERQSGAFERRFRLPEGIDTSAITAAFREGVLQITIPKLPKEQPLKIQVAA